MNFAVDIYACNDRYLMIEYRKQPTSMGGLTSNRVLSSHGKIRLRLVLEKNPKDLILNPQNVYYLVNNPCNLINLGLFNNSEIYYNNKWETLYYIKYKKAFAKTQL